jgi:hypothetical protein
MKNKKRSINPLYTALRKQNKKFWQRWYQMCVRCGNTSKKYRAYRTVRVCDEWKGHQGFINFYDDMGLPPTDKHQLDRVNPFGHYEPGNVVWATAKQNMNNMRVHHRGNGRYKKLAIENGINTRTFYKRVRTGWRPLHAATMPAQLGSTYKQRLR